MKFTFTSSVWGLGIVDGQEAPNNFGILYLLVNGNLCSSVP